MEESIGIHNIDTGIGGAGVGFVVVPSDVNREQYIIDCYRTNTLTINGGKGYGYFSAVHTDVNVMQQISFPIDSENRGTAVIWIKDAISQLPVIVGALRKQNEYYSLAENQYRLKRNNIEKTRVVELFIDGDSSALELNIVGDKEEPANVNIKLSSQNKDSIFNLSCDNELSVFSEKSINIESNQSAVVKITEKGKTKTEISCNKERVNIISSEINHNNGEEPMVLGNTLKSILDEIISAVSSITVMSSAPGTPSSPPVNMSSFVNIKTKLNTILSKKSNLE